MNIRLTADLRHRETDCLRSLLKQGDNDLLVHVVAKYSNRANMQGRIAT
jgi:hypothetical protein